MKPVSFRQANVTYAENQPEYNPLPSHRTADGIVISCWQLSGQEIQEVNNTGKVWVWVHTFNRPLQPMSLETSSPFTEDQGKVVRRSRGRWFRILQGLKTFLRGAK